MTKKYEKALFIFHRDLRLEDNTTLLETLDLSKTVIACFIFTPEQIESNPYKGMPALQFMIESLQDLDLALQNRGSKLYIFYGHPEEVVEKLIIQEKIDLCAFNKDVTPYSQKRDKKIEKTALSLGVSCLSMHDAFLHDPETCVKSDGKPYTIFTPFYKTMLKASVNPPRANHYKNFAHHKIALDEGSHFFSKILTETKVQQKGGRTQALKILKHLEKFSHYKETRDIPDLDATTHLSPHMKFTTVSPREVFYGIEDKIGPESDLARSLFWRDFFSVIALRFPHVFKGAFHEKFDQLKWQNDPLLFKKWCQGNTGFPIVDAGMRQLNETGFMHNRLRMIVGSFLVKDLHIHWHEGEKYFAKHLIDYDPAVNNGNWQWVASTGCDAQPYFRIFNPWLQGLKFDPEADFIKKYIPELKNVPAKIIHNWNKEENWIFCQEYPKPIIDHSIESAKALKAYKAI